VFVTCGDLELHRWIGFKCLLLSEEQQSASLLYPRDRLVQKVRLRLESPPQAEARPFSPYAVAILPKTGAFPSDKSTNKSGLSPMLWCSCPVT